MAASIIIDVKPNIPTKVYSEYFDVLDQYLISQGVQILTTDRNIRVYFISKQIPPTHIKHFVSIVKQTKGFQQVVANVYSSGNMQKN